MIVRVLPSGKVVIIGHISAENEDAFLEGNKGNSQFRKINGLPPAQFGNYKVNETGSIVIDEEAESIELQRQLDKQSRDELYTTDWKVIRELEKLYLSDTDLHAERQAIRDSISNV